MEHSLTLRSNPLALLPLSINIRLRANQHASILSDCHGQIWREVEVLAQDNPKIFEGVVVEVEARLISHIGYRAAFPVRRLMVLWRNLAWRSMISKWCASAIGYETFNLSAWAEMARLRIDDFWFDQFTTVLTLLQQYFGAEAMAVSLKQWNTRRSELELEGANALPDIQKLVKAHCSTGHTVAGVMQHVVYWVNPSAQKNNGRTSNKPQRYLDLTDTIQTQGSSTAAQTAQRLQRAVAVLVTDNLELFLQTTEPYLERLEASDTAYLAVLQKAGPWQGLYSLVRLYFPTPLKHPLLQSFDPVGPPSPEAEQEDAATPNSLFVPNTPQKLTETCRLAAEHLLRAGLIPGLGPGSEAYEQLRQQIQELLLQDLASLLDASQTQAVLVSQAARAPAKASASPQEAQPATSPTAAPVVLQLQPDNATFQQPLDLSTNSVTSGLTTNQSPSQARAVDQVCPQVVAPRQKKRNNAATRPATSRGLKAPPIPTVKPTWM